MDGMINIYKEKGYTSHDVVAKLRGILHTKKIGHTGTLDPEAEGVLLVCIGKGTKLCDMLTDRTKSYRAIMQLGVSTDTEDMTGQVLEKRTVNVTEEQIKSVAASFEGEYEQVPPMYSALKVNGKKLYELAREGKVVERKPRLVEILSINIEDISLPFVTMTVVCSKGTYIRSLCRDIGEALGCLGAMKELLRIRVGDFTLETAITLREVERLAENGSIEERIYPVEDAFKDLPKLVVESSLDKKVDNGNSFFLRADKRIGNCIRVYKKDGTFIGIYKLDKESGQMKPEQLFFLEGR